MYSKHNHYMTTEITTTVQKVQDYKGPSTFIQKMKTLILAQTQKDVSLKSLPFVNFIENLSELMTMLNQQMFSGVINIKEIVAQFPIELSNRLIEHDAHELMVFIRDQIDKTHLRIHDAACEISMTPFQGKYL